MSRTRAPLISPASRLGTSCLGGVSHVALFAHPSCANVSDRNWGAWIRVLCTTPRETCAVDQVTIHFDTSGTVKGLQDTILGALVDGVGGIVILACHANEFTPATLDPLLKSVASPLIGGVFPTVIYGGRAYQRGSVVLAFRGRMAVRTVPGLSAGGAGTERALAELEEQSASSQTMMVFVDGFVPRVTPFMNSLFDVFGLEINYIGGGAGCLEADGQPCLLSGEGMRADAAVMALVEIACGIGVAHGWHPMSEPMQATAAEGNLLKELEFRTALEVYAEAVARQSGPSIQGDGFLSGSRRHPFGLARMDREMIVRDPLRVTPEGAIVCAGEIPQDCYLSVMSGDEDSLLDAAQRAAAMAVAALPGGKPAAFLLMDCISRRQFLAGRFAEELVRMAPGGLPSAGACTIGEIANSGAEFLEFYNKTAVVAAMGAG